MKHHVPRLLAAALPLLLLAGSGAGAPALVPPRAHVAPAAQSQRWQAPVSLRLWTADKHYPRRRLTLSVELTNRSAHRIAVTGPLSRSVCLEIRDSDGYLVNLGKPVVDGYWPMQAMELAPGERATTEIRWSERYREPTGSTISVRCVYALNGWQAEERTAVRRWACPTASNSLVLSFGDSGATALGSAEALWPQVKLSCLLPGRSLVWATAGPDGGGSPGLFLVDSAGRKPVRGISDLQGSIRVETEQDALAVVRLATSPYTHRAFSERLGLELLPQEEWPDEWFGVLPAARCAKWHLASPRVARQGEQYVIERCLVMYPNRQGGRAEVCRSEEHLGVDGSYAWRVKRILRRVEAVDPTGPRLPYY